MFLIQKYQYRVLIACFSLLNHRFFTIIDVNAFHRRLGAEFTAINRVPTILV